MEVKSLETINLINVHENETFAYSLILVKGFVNEECSGTFKRLVVRNSGQGANTVVETRIVHGKFVVLLHLEQGENEFTFDIDGLVCKRTFFYRPPTTANVVTPLYVVCGDENGNSNLTEIQDKITLGCRLVQTLIAETLFQCGYGKKTFSLEEADQNGNSCLIFNSELNLDDAIGMSSEKLWEYLGREIMTSQYGCSSRKYLAFLSRSKNENSEYLAIGGGGLALCDAKYLRTWPTSVIDINSCFANTNPEMLNSSSMLNNALYGSGFSISLGAVCHELCHTFDLGHTVEGIMGRDFDRVGSLFTIVDDAGQQANVSRPRNFSCLKNRNDSLITCEGTLRRKLNISFSVTRSNANAYHFGDRNFLERPKNLNEIFPRMVFWFGGCATLLAYHRWINHERSVEDTDSNLLHYDHLRSIVTSKLGIVVVQLRKQDGYIFKYWDFSGKRKKTLFLVPICEVRRACCIVIEDIEGNLLKRDIEQIL